MIGRRFTFIGLAIPAVFAAGPGVWAQKVVETMPAKDGTLSSADGDYFVRFDQPVDHIHATIDIMQNGKTVQMLHPRLKSEPNVLFARAPNLAPGKYVMHWSVPSANGSTVYQGNVSFSVEQGRP
ncbi:MAG TPA: copper resistance protein CopC [Reyranella sp.]|jgi:methionine-rich copper-binding protein CopC|nr:copper resistance protein CopC [Reyranella sp.]